MKLSFSAADAEVDLEIDRAGLRQSVLAADACDLARLGINIVSVSHLRSLEVMLLAGFEHKTYRRQLPELKFVHAERVRV